MLRNTLAAAALAIISAAPVTAAQIELDLTFGGVTATFLGLDDAVSDTQEATSFSFTGWYDTYTATSPFVENEFTFSGGILSDVFLDARIAGDNDLNSLDLYCETDYCSIIELSSDLEKPTNSTFGLFSPTVRPVAPVPLPAGGLLLITGIAGVVALKRRKKVAA